MIPRRRGAGSQTEEGAWRWPLTLLFLAQRATLKEEGQGGWEVASASLISNDTVSGVPSFSFGVTFDGKEFGFPCPGSPGELVP